MLNPRVITEASKKYIYISGSITEAFCVYYVVQSLDTSPYPPGSVIQQIIHKGLSQKEINTQKREQCWNSQTFHGG